MSNISFKTIAKSESPTRTVIKTRDFIMIVDEPENLGGTDHGPNPVEYLQASLAGCLNVVGHLVAKELGFKINKLEIEIEGTLNPNNFLGKSNEERAGYKIINVTLKVDSSADENTLSEWVKIIEKRCPVSDNISNATEVNIKAVK